MKQRYGVLVYQKNEAVSSQSAIEDDDWEAEEMIRKAKRRCQDKSKLGVVKEKEKEVSFVVVINIIVSRSH